jgi:hypothetical protein
LTRSNARSGPKYHMTPRPLSQGHRRAALGKKRKWKSPVRRRRGPEKIPVRDCQRTRNILGSPAQGGLKNAKLPHLSGRAIEGAHDGTPETKMSGPWQSCLRRRASIGLLQPNRMGCLYAISQLRERGRRRVGRARAAVMRKRCGGLRFRLIGPTSSIVSGGSRYKPIRSGAGPAYRCAHAGYACYFYGIVSGAMSLTFDFRSRVLNNVSRRSPFSVSITPLNTPSSFLFSANINSPSSLNWRIHASTWLVSILIFRFWTRWMIFARMCSSKLSWNG